MIDCRVSVVVLGKYICPLQLYIWIMVLSEFGEPVKYVEGFVTQRSNCIASVANIAVFMRLEDADHIVCVENNHKAWYNEEEPAYSLPSIDDDWRSFILLIHIFFVVHVVSTHLED